MCVCILINQHHCGDRFLRLLSLYFYPKSICYNQDCLLELTPEQATVSGRTAFWQVETLSRTGLVLWGIPDVQMWHGGGDGAFHSSRAHLFHIVFLQLLINWRQYLRTEYDGVPPSHFMYNRSSATFSPGAQPETLQQCPEAMSFCHFHLTENKYYRRLKDVSTVCKIPLKLYKCGHDKHQTPAMQRVSLSSIVSLDG